MVQQSLFLRIKSMTIGVLLILIATPGLAATVKGVQFEDTITIDKNILKIQGVALLKWARLIDVYAGAFYLPDNHPARDWTRDIPKGLELVYFRKIKAEDFINSSTQLLKRNLASEKYRALEERLFKFLGFFRDVKPGDRYLLIYSPLKGTQLRLNGQPLGIIPGGDFAVAYFGIWLGDNPISERFRDGLLKESP